MHAAPLADAATSGVLPWIFGIATLVGVAIAVPPLLDYFIKRRQRRAADEFFDALANHADAEEARKELAEIRHVLNTAKRVVPLEARRLSLINQRASLQATIGEQYDALIRCESELADVELTIGNQALADEDPDNDLAAEVRNRIRTEIYKGFLHARRQSRLTGALLIIVLVLLLLPFQVSPSFAIQRYVDVIYRGDQYGPASVWGAAILGSLVLGMLLAGVIAWVMEHSPRTRWRLWGWLGLLVSISSCAIAGVLLYNLTDQLDPYNFDDGGIQRSVGACALVFTASTAFGCAILFRILCQRLVSRVTSLLRTNRKNGNMRASL